MKYILILSLFIISCAPLKVQHSELESKVTANQEIKAFQEKLTEDYKNPETSPLKDKATEFKGHEFFRLT